MEKFQKIVVTAFIVDGGKVLVVKRSDNESFLPGYWEMPGGKVEFSEHPADALVRECLEEVNLQVKVGRPYRTFSYISNDGNRHTVEIDYLCTPFSKEVEISSAHTEYRWISRDELSTLKFSEEMQKSIAEGFEI